AHYRRARGMRFIYRRLLRPRLHLLDYRVRSRIFQGPSPENGPDATEIIKEVLKGAGIADDAVEWGKLKGKYPKREFCMQYQESELAFILRLLEDEGIHFHFRH